MKETIGYYRNIKNEILPFIPSESKTILDVGCGEGYFLMDVKNKKNNKIETWGIEPVEEISEEGAKNVDHFILGKVEEQLQSIPDHYLDVITFNDVLEHLLEPGEVLNKN
jgi:ubiquinone/menaquinone biosynthesis C-methylase UbiE